MIRKNFGLLAEKTQKSNDDAYIFAKLSFITK